MLLHLVNLVGGAIPAVHDESLQSCLQTHDSQCGVVDCDLSLCTDLAKWLSSVNPGRCGDDVQDRVPKELEALIVWPDGRVVKRLCESFL